MDLVIVLSYEVPDEAAGEVLAQIIGEILDRTSNEPFDIRQARTFVAIGDAAERITAEFRDA